MAEEKTSTLVVDGKPAVQGFQDISRAAEDAKEAVGDYAASVSTAEAETKDLGNALRGASEKAASLSSEVERTETQTRRLAGTSRDYNSAARSVGDSVQAITRFEQIYREAILDTGNSAKVRAQIMAVALSRTIGGTLDEKRAMEMLGAGHKDAAAAIRFMVEHGAVVAPTMNNAALASLAFGTRLGDLRSVAQQAGYQVADMANQIGNGTSAYTAVGQQMGQLLGVFGATGAVVGAAVSVMAPLAGKLMDTASAAKEAGQAQKDYNAALREGEGLLRTEAALEGERAERIREGAIQARTDQYEKLQREIASLELKRRENTAVTPTETGEGDATILNEKEEARLQGLITIKQRQLSELQAQISGLTNQNPQATAVKRKVLSSGDGLESMTAQRGAIQDAIDIAAAAGDDAALKELTEAYGALNRGIATFITDGQRAAMVAEAQAKASAMTSAEGQKYLTVRMAEINAMGKAIELGELEQQQKAAQVEAAATAAKAYRDMAKAMTMGEIETTAKIAVSGLDAERQALAQRRALGEIGAAEELALALDIEDRKRQIAERAAQAKLSLLRRTAGTERTEIDAAERAITELKAQHETERKRQADEAMAARVAQVKQLAQIEAEAVAASAGRRVDGKAEDIAMAKVTGDLSGAREIAAAERALAAERFQIECDLLDKKLAAAGEEPEKRARILNEIKAAEEKHVLDLKRIDRQATQDRLAEIKSWTEPFKSAISQMVGAFISGTQTMRQIGARAMQSIAASYAGRAANWGFDKAATGVVTSVAGKGAAATLGLGDSGTGTAQVAATTANTTALHTLTAALTGNTTATATDTAATTANTGATTTSVGSQVAGLAVNTTGDATNTGAVAALTTAVGANTAAQGGSAWGATLSSMLPGFAVGAWDLPADQIAQVHKGEMIVPAATAPTVRSVLAGRSGLGGGGNAAVAAAMSAINSRLLPPAGGIPNTGFTMPSAGRFALPDWLGKGPNFEAARSMSNSTTTTNATTVNHTFNINALDGASVQAWANANAPKLAASLGRYYDRNPSKKPR